MTLTDSNANTEGLQQEQAPASPMSGAWTPSSDESLQNIGADFEFDTEWDAEAAEGAEKDAADSNDGNVEAPTNDSEGQAEADNESGHENSAAYIGEFTPVPIPEDQELISTIPALLTENFPPPSMSDFRTPEEYIDALISHKAQLKEITAGGIERLTELKDNLDQARSLNPKVPGIKDVLEVPADAIRLVQESPVAIEMIALIFEKPGLFQKWSKLPAPKLYREVIAFEQRVMSAVDAAKGKRSQNNNEPPPKRQKIDVSIPGSRMKNTTLANLKKPDTFLQDSDPDMIDFAKKFADTYDR